MPVTALIAQALNAIVVTLDPLQRWQAARRFDGNWITEKWFIITSLLILITLITIIFIISLNRNAQKNKTKKLTAAKLAQHKGLSPYEIQTLKNITNNPKLKNKSEIFTNKKAFDDSAKKIIEEQKQQKSPEQIQKLKTKLNILGEKLGFQENEYTTTDTELLQKINTKQIPTGKIIYIQAKASKTDSIESTVIENTETGLSVKLTAHPRINFSEQWRGRYSFEDNVCEFDTSIISYDGTCLVLAHSEKVHCFNRRRFQREPIEYQALIALFPRNKTTEEKNLDNKTDTDAAESPQQSNSAALCPPKFTNATVTEIGGPSLKIKTDLEAREGDRILIILDLSEKNSSDSSENTKPGEQKQKIVQDIAVIKRTAQTQEGNFLSAEMFGLSDEHIEELVHATNTAPADANAAPTDTNAAPTHTNTAPTGEPQEKSDNTNNTNTNEENQQSNITQEA